MEANGINYYKGVLLCSRPNQSPSVNLTREFCGRVYPHQQLGLVPVKQFDEKKTKKRVLPVLNNHKKWLENFKKEIQDQKQQEQKEKQKNFQRLEKIKQQGQQQREKAKSNSQTKNDQPQPVKLPQIPQSNMKKKQKPAWAKTAQQVEETAQKQVDDLLDFFNSQQNGDIKDYVSDDDVKKLLFELKNKIQTLKQKQDWKNSQMKKIQENKAKVQDEKQKDKDDVLSRISKQSGAQSISSQKTAERVQQLERKKKEVQWDRLTASEKKTKASVDQQIAKNIADQVLRNYPALKHHSNQSIRQLIEKHAHQQIKS